MLLVFFTFEVHSPAFCCSVVCKGKMGYLQCGWKKRQVWTSRITWHLALIVLPRLKDYHRPYHISVILVFLVLSTEFGSLISLAMATETAKSSESQDSSVDEPIPFDCIRVENKIYSAKELANLHPGGPLFIRAFAGRDATEPFMSYHRRRFPHSRVTSALLGPAKDESFHASDYDDFFELCERVDKVLPRLQSFAPWSYYLKAVGLMVLALTLEMYMHINASYKWYISALCGWLFAIIGLAIQHDANHGALSKRPWVNRLWGMSLNWSGGSAVSWIHQHVVQHHVYTNDTERDPDIEGVSILRLNPLQPLLKFQMGQHIYFFFLILGYGFSFIFHGFSTMVEGINFTPLSPLLASYRFLEWFLSILFFTRWIFFPLYQVPSFYTLLNTAPMAMVGGWWLSYFFTISHNFEGVQQIDPKNTPKSLVYKTCVTSSNVGGRWLCFLNGGLNYQIEHHLFPRMHHGHYPMVAEVVKEFCREKGYPYKHFDTLWENTVSLGKHLFDMGTNPRPKSYFDETKDNKDSKSKKNAASLLLAAAS